MELTEKKLLGLGFKRVMQKNSNLKFEDYPHYYRLREGYTDEIEIQNLNQTNCFVFCWGRMSVKRLRTEIDVINLVTILIKKD